MKTVNAGLQKVGSEYTPGESFGCILDWMPSEIQLFYLLIFVYASWQDFGLETFRESYLLIVVIVCGGKLASHIFHEIFIDICEVLKAPQW